MASKKAFDDWAGATEEDDEATERALTLLVWWLGRERSDLRPIVDAVDVLFLARGGVAVLRRIDVLKADAISLIVPQSSSYISRQKRDEVVEAMIIMQKILLVTQNGTMIY